MKRIIIALVLCFVSTTTIFAQSQDTVNFQIIATTLDKAGDFIESGAKLKNTGIAIGIVGSAAGAGIMYLGYTDERYVGLGRTEKNKASIIAGATIAGASGLTYLILTIVGNNRISTGGTILKNIEFNGYGINVKF